MSKGAPMSKSTNRELGALRARGSLRMWVNLSKLDSGSWLRVEVYSPAKVSVSR